MNECNTQKIVYKSPKGSIDLTPLAQPSLGFRPFRYIGLADQFLILDHLWILLALIFKASTILLVEYFDNIIAQVILHISLVALGLLRVHGDVAVGQTVFVETVGGLVAFQLIRFLVLLIGKV